MCKCLDGPHTLVKKPVHTQTNFKIDLLPIRPKTPLDVVLEGLPSKFNGSRPKTLKASLGSDAGKRK